MRLRCDYKLSLDENGYFLHNKPQKELDTSSIFKKALNEHFLAFLLVFFFEVLEFWSN
jgi:hypothetical protein